MKRESFTLEIDVEPYGGIPGIIRLRSFLKCALRQWRIRCRRIAEAPATAATAAGDDTNAAGRGSAEVRRG